MPNKKLGESRTEDKTSEKKISMKSYFDQPMDKQKSTFSISGLRNIKHQSLTGVHDDKLNRSSNNTYIADQRILQSEL